MKADPNDSGSEDGAQSERPGSSSGEHGTRKRSRGGSHQGDAAAAGGGSGSGADRMARSGPPISSEDQEAKLRRQQMLNKAAQQRYRQRRKERQQTIEMSLGQMQEQNAALQAQVMALETALMSAQLHQQQHAQATGGPLLLAPGLQMALPVAPPPMVLVPQPSHSQELGGLSGPMGSGGPPGLPMAPQALPSPQSRPPMRGPPLMPTQQQQQQQQQQQHVYMPAVTAAGPGMPPDRGGGPPDGLPHPHQLLLEGAASAGGSGSPLPAGGNGGPLPPAVVRAQEQHRSKVAALQAFVNEMRLRDAHLKGEHLPREQASELRSLVAAAAESCAAALDVASEEVAWPICGAPDAADAVGGSTSQGGAPGGSFDKQRWLQVLADVSLTDDQMRELLQLRGALLDALGRCLGERRALAERLLAFTVQDPNGRSCLQPLARGQQLPQVAALQERGYVEGIARCSLAVREVARQLQGGVAAEGGLVRDFTLNVLSSVLTPEQAALVITANPHATDVLNLGNALSEIYEMVPRLGSICNTSMPTAAIITAAAAAAGAAIRRSGSGAVPASAPPAGRPASQPDVPGPAGGGGGGPGGRFVETQTPSLSSSGHGHGLAASGMASLGQGPGGPDGDEDAIIARRIAGGPAAAALRRHAAAGRGAGPRRPEQQQDSDHRALQSFMWELMGDDADAGAAAATAAAAAVAAAGGGSGGGKQGGATPRAAAGSGRGTGSSGGGASAGAAGRGAGAIGTPSLLAAIGSFGDGTDDGGEGGIGEDGELLSSLDGVLEDGEGI